MILVFFTHAGEVTDDLDTELTEQLAVADTRALEDLRRAQGTRAEDDHLAGLDLEKMYTSNTAQNIRDIRAYDSLVELTAMSAIARRDIGDANSLVVVVEENAVDTRIAAEEQVVLDIHDGVDVRGSGIATTTSMPVDVLGPDFRTVSSCEVLNIVCS